MITRLVIYILVDTLMSVVVVSAQTAADCEAMSDPVGCTSIGCYYNETRLNDSSGLSPCMERVVIEPKYGNATVEDPWCKDHFPFEVTVALYFVNCFTTGFGLIGLWYNTYHYGTRTKIDVKTKKRFRNRLHGSQDIFLFWCGTFVIAGILMVTTAMIYLMSPTNCYWVYVSYLYFAICLFCFLFFGWRISGTVINSLAQSRRQRRLDKKRVAGMFDNIVAQRPGTGMRYL
eukprot:TRINITY_DN29231_c0_g1_i1.p1 TRINITY_DN29231_c0_g1~~TRINITY_DN29231_c0_g1_i1.p1  ORF type:complete len:231 (+),score=2.42 TRINITY_DN29231_c0_g1_i1:36-728(+)